MNTAHEQKADEERGDDEAVAWQLSVNRINTIEDRGRTSLGGRESLSCAPGRAIVFYDGSSFSTTKAWSNSKTETILFRERQACPHVFTTREGYYVVERTKELLGNPAQPQKPTDETSREPRVFSEKKESRLRAT